MKQSGWRNFKSESVARSEKRRAFITKDVLANVPVNATSYIINRVKTALSWAKNWELLKKIEDCRVGQFCGSLYCKTCRKRAVGTFETRLLSHCSQQFGGDNKLALSRLRYVTVLCELTSVDLDSAKDAVSLSRKNLNAFKRRFPAIWLQGTFEFELVSFKLSKARKKKTLTQMDTTGKDVQVLVHFHALMDIKSYEEAKVKAWLSRRWQGDHRVHVQSTHTDQSIEDKCRQLASYGFKNRVKFNPTFDAMDFENGRLFKNGELADLVAIYDGIGERGCSSLLIKMGS